MKPLNVKIQEQLNQPMQKDDETLTTVRRLEKIVVDLAREIDNLHKIKHQKGHWYFNAQSLPADVFFEEARKVRDGVVRVINTSFSNKDRVLLEDLLIMYDYMVSLIRDLKEQTKK